MRRVLEVLTLAFFVVSLVPGRAAGRENKTAREKSEKGISDVEARRFRAIVATDLTALNQLLSDDLTYTHSSGWTQTKAEYIESLRSGELKYLSFEASDVKVRVYGNAAVVNGIAEVKARSKGQETVSKIRYLDVYVKQQGDWKQVAWESTRLSQ